MQPLVDATSLQWLVSFVLDCTYVLFATAGVILACRAILLMVRN